MGPDEELKIELPLKYLDEKVDRVRFTVATTKPGFINQNSAKNMMSRATDVYPGGHKVLVNSGVINGYGIFTIGASGKWLKGGGGGGGSTTDHSYWYNNIGQQICEKEIGAATVYRYYLHGYGILSRKEGSLGTSEYLHTDVLGSITAITDNSGSEVATYAYDPFGDLLTSALYLGNWAFTGQERDSETDFYHFPARYYDPEWGRFLTPDPYTNLPDDARNLVNKQPYDIRIPHFFRSCGRPKLTLEVPSGFSVNVWPVTDESRTFNFCGNPKVLNRYPYVRNNPVKYTDKYGYYAQMAFCLLLADCIKTNCNRQWPGIKLSLPYIEGYAYEHSSTGWSQWCEDKQNNYFNACMAAFRNNAYPPQPSYFPECGGLWLARPFSTTPVVE